MSVICLLTCRASQLDLTVNRLSGDIPPVLMTANNVSFLSGNIFECMGGNLPAHDPSSSSYICGSADFNFASIAWTTVCSAFILVGILLTRAASSGPVDGSPNTPSATEQAETGSIYRRLVKDKIFLKWFHFAISLFTSIDIMKGFQETASRSFDSRLSSQSLRDLFPGLSNSILSPKEDHNSIQDTSKTCEAATVSGGSNHNPNETVARRGVFAQEMLTMLSMFPHTFSFVMTLRRCAQAAFMLSVFYLTIVLPLYLILKFPLGGYFSTHSSQYLWVTTAAFVHDYAPAVVVLVAALISFSQLERFFKYVFDGVDHQRDINEMKFARSRGLKAILDSSTVFRNIPVWMLNYLIPGTLHLINITFTMCLNVAYVLAIVDGVSETSFVIIQLGLSIAKLSWNNAALPFLGFYLQYLTAYEITRHFMVMMVFNYIVGPVLATVITDVNCLYYVFVATDAVTTTIPVVEPNKIYCAANVISGAVTCSLLPQEYELTSTFVPPWLYSYQCSSSVLENYVPVLLFTYVISGLISPIALIVSSRFFYHFQHIHDDDCCTPKIENPRIDAIAGQIGASPSSVVRDEPAVPTRADSTDNQLELMEMQGEYSTALRTVSKDSNRTASSDKLYLSSKRTSSDDRRLGNFKKQVMDFASARARGSIFLPHHESRLILSNGSAAVSAAAANALFDEGDDSSTAIGDVSFATAFTESRETIESRKPATLGNANDTISYGNSILVSGRRNRRSSLGSVAFAVDEETITKTAKNNGDEEDGRKRLGDNSLDRKDKADLKLSDQVKRLTTGRGLAAVNIVERPSSEGSNISAIDEKAFDASLAVVRVLVDFAVLLTFGLAAPLFSIVVCVCIFNRFVVWTMLAGFYATAYTLPTEPGSVSPASSSDRRAQKGRSLGTSLNAIAAYNRLEQSCIGSVQALMSCILVLVIVVSCFWALFAFDWAADVHGYEKGIIACVCTALILPLAYSVVALYHQTENEKMLMKNVHGKSPALYAENRARVLFPGLARMSQRVTRRSSAQGQSQSPERVLADGTTPGDTETDTSASSSSMSRLSIASIRSSTSNIIKSSMSLTGWFPSPTTQGSEMEMTVSAESVRESVPESVPESGRQSGRQSARISTRESTLNPIVSDPFQETKSE
jgi:hypothetical protein